MRKKNTIRLNESQLHNMISESVKKVLNEMSLHKGSQVYSNTNPNGDPNDNDWKWKYDGDTIDRYLWRMKKEAQSDGGAGPKGFPMAHWFAKNYRRYFKYLDEYSGDIVIAPTTVDYPDYEMSPEKLYKSIDELWHANQIGYDNERCFGYLDRWN